MLSSLSLLSLVSSTSFVAPARPLVCAPRLAPPVAILPPDLLAAAPVPSSAVPSAFAAYGHYLSLLLMVGSLTTQSLTVKENMSEEEFDKASNADILNGVAGLLLAVTGYLRATQYGKGWEFYQHEPIFWAKLTLVGVLGAASFFPTTKYIQLAIAKRNPDTPYRPMGPKLVKRMSTLINAQLLALASIPLTATLMARGVGYNESFPWQAGAAAVALSVFGLGYKYIKEALEFEEGAF